MFCSAGRRVQLLKNLKVSLGTSCQIIATDLQNVAPALYVADKRFIVPRIDDPRYVDIILDIARKNDVKAITTLIDPEIEILAKNTERHSDGTDLRLVGALQRRITKARNQVSCIHQTPNRKR